MTENDSTIRARVHEAIRLKWQGCGQLAIDPTLPPEKRRGKFVARIVATSRASPFTMLHTFGDTEDKTLRKLLQRINNEAVVEVCEIDIKGHPV